MARRTIVRGRCELCKAPTAAMPGPSNGLGRAAAPTGYALGFVVEQAGRDFVICTKCLKYVMEIPQ